MKKLLLASVAGIALVAGAPANAADLGQRPTYKVPPIVAPVPLFTWTGCYVGGHVGGGWGFKDFADPARGDGALHNDFIGMVLPRRAFEPTSVDFSAVAKSVAIFNSRPTGWPGSRPAFLEPISKEMYSIPSVPVRFSLRGRIGSQA
jgi:hypothetical protein